MNYRIALRLFVYGNANLFSAVLANWFFDGSKSACLAVFMLLGFAYEMCMVLPEFFKREPVTVVCRNTACPINMRQRGYGFIGMTVAIVLFGFLMISAWNNRSWAEGKSNDASITEKLMKSTSPMYKAVDKQ